MIIESGETKFGVVVLHGSLKKKQSWPFFFRSSVKVVVAENSPEKR